MKTMASVKNDGRLNICDQPTAGVKVQSNVKAGRDANAAARTDSYSNFKFLVVIGD